MTITRALGIDMGRICALAVIVPSGNLGSVLHWRRAEGLSLAELRKLIDHTIEVFGVEIVATETPFVGGHHRTTASQREKFSVVKTICQERKIKLVSYAPSEVKKAICGNGRASKEQVGRAVQRMLKIPSDDEHVLDACAIGMLAMSREGGR